MLPAVCCAAQYRMHLLPILHALQAVYHPYLVVYSMSGFKDAVQRAPCASNAPAGTEEDALNGGMRIDL